MLCNLPDGSENTGNVDFFYMHSPDGSKCIRVCTGPGPTSLWGNSGEHCKHDLGTWSQAWSGSEDFVYKDVHIYIIRTHCSYMMDIPSAQEELFEYRVFLLGDNYGVIR